MVVDDWASPDIVRTAEESDELGEAGCRHADQGESDGRERYRFEGVLRGLHEDAGPERKRAEREFISWWLGRRQEREAKQ